MARGRGGKRSRGWERNSHYQPNKRSSRVLYDRSWLNDPWIELQMVTRNTGHVLYHASWLDDPWMACGGVPGALYHASWMGDPWEKLV